MKRAVFLLICCLALLLTACAGAGASATDPATASPVTEPSAPQFGNFRLGMSVSEFLSYLEETNLEIELPDYGLSPIPKEAGDAPKDGRIYNGTDLSFYYRIRGRQLQFTFSFEETLQSIFCQDTAFATAEGLCSGDNIQRMIQLYGTAYEKDVEDYPVYQYQLDGGYLNVFYNDDTVTGWSVTSYSNINND